MILSISTTDAVMAEVSLVPIEMPLAMSIFFDELTVFASV